MTQLTSSSPQQGAPSALALARSFLFVPANRPERYAKALASGAGAVIIDLEDAVPPDAKVAARKQLADGFEGFTASERARVLVRGNASGTPWHEDDLMLLRQLTRAGLAGVMLPKIESAAEISHAAASVGQACALLPMLESAAGLHALDALAQSPQVLRLVFGNLDFQADLGMACGPDEIELQPVRLALVLASRRAGLVAPVDGVISSTHAVPGQVVALGTKPRRPTDAAPIACTLSSQSMRGRLEEWRQLLSHVTNRAPIDSGLRATFGSATPLDELMSLVAAEQDCCQFFDFAITVDTRGIALEVRSPADALPVLQSLFGAPA